MDDRVLRRINDLPDIEILVTELPSGVLGCTDGATVWLNRRQRQRQMRSTLTHELEHLGCGHTACQPPAVERAVEERAARYLITMQELTRRAAVDARRGTALR